MGINARKNMVRALPMVIWRNSGLGIVVNLLSCQPTVKKQTTENRYLAHPSCFSNIGLGMGTVRNMFCYKSIPNRPPMNEVRIKS